MHKLKGTSSGKNNKSCGIFHHESKKIGFAFLLFFYDLLRNLQETAKALLLFELPIAGRPSKRFFSLQCGPWAMAGVGWANSGEAHRSLAREGREEGLGVTRVLFGSSAGGWRTGDKRWRPLWLPD
jgi:hypothetical protein